MRFQIFSVEGRMLASLERGPDKPKGRQDGMVFATKATFLEAHKLILRSLGSAPESYKSGPMARGTSEMTEPRTKTEFIITSRFGLQESACRRYAQESLEWATAPL